MRKVILFFTLLSGSAAVWLAVGARQSVPAAAKVAADTSTNGVAHAPAPLPTLKLAQSVRPQDPELAQIFGPLWSMPDYENAISAVHFDLTGRLRAHPELAKKLEAMLATGAHDQVPVKIAVSALTAAGTAESQAVLARLTDTRKDDARFLEMLVPTMGFATKPSAELEGALRHLTTSDRSADVRQMAHFALGNAAGRMEDPARSKSIIDSYDRELARAGREDDVVTYLGALGNAATPDAAHVVQRYLHDDRSAVRAEAVDALRRVATPEAERELTSALQKDADAAVRANAAAALSYRKPSADLIHVESAALTDERNVDVARRLLDNLWSARSSNEDAIAAINSVADSHPVDAVREEARKLLAQSSGS
jgi:HEAT repeat protein